MSSIAAFSVLLTDRDELRNRCEALMMKNQCIAGLAAEAKKLRENLTDCVKTDGTSRPSPKCRGRKRVTTTDKRLIALEAKLEEAETAHARLADISARYNANSAETRPGPGSLRYVLAKWCKGLNWQVLARTTLESYP